MIEAKRLTYVFPDGSVGIKPTTFVLPTGSRTLLIGANGAGKSTLLRVLSGKTLAKAGAVVIDGKDPFRDSVQGITYLGTEWAGNVIVRQDVPVALLLSSIGGDAFPERRDQLVDILDIDLRWRMHQVSDGERRRVQLAMGLMKPWHFLLLDEVTVDLDVLVRSRLLDFLQKETERRECQIVYATHIFDGLGHWPTHLAHMHLGEINSIEKYELTQTLTETGNSPLMELALSWLKQDLKKRGERTEKLKWDDIRDEVIAHGPLEHHKEDGFDAYFRASRARD
ncbi:hypothetical protein TRVA0_009S00430 [Trichomonascus vanleenenianus]|uniref:putative ATP-binding cassette family ATPase CAF16 n=1 Tax=Trichomonascus vanleenenianus TaxID=2268995 RepID=UPI003ECA647C